MKKILSIAAALALLSTSASAATLRSTAGMGQEVKPSRVIDNYRNNYKANSLWPENLLDNRALTSYNYIEISSLANNKEPCLTFKFDNASISGVWMRIGDLTSKKTYYDHARPSYAVLTLHRRDGSKVSLEYDVDDIPKNEFDDYMAMRNDEWYDGYQMLNFGITYTNVTAIDMFFTSTGSKGEHPNAVHNVHISDTVFIYDARMDQTPEVYAATVTKKPAATQKPAASQPVYGNGKAIDTLYTRSGPSTTYDEIGAYELRGQRVNVITAAWDTRNDIYWLQVDVNEGKPNHRRIYTGLKRISIDVNSVPHEQLIGTCTVKDNSKMFYGPGDNYEKRFVSLPVGTTGSVFNIENGYVQFEFKPDGAYQSVRVWLPESAVQFK